MTPKAELVLTDDEREQLERWSRRRKSSQALASRSRIVLACAAGADNKAVAVQVAELLGVSKQRLHQLLGRDDFPDPVVRLAAGHVWLVSSIRALERGSGPASRDGLSQRFLYPGLSVFTVSLPMGEAAGHVPDLAQDCLDRMLAWKAAIVTAGADLDWP